MSSLLEVNDLSVSFHSYIGTIRAVRGVSFSVARGETLAVVGESGCGKTVTAKALMRLFGNTSAVIDDGSEIMFDGRDVVKMSREELYELRGKGIGMIFQDPMTSLNPTMPVGAQIMEGILTHHRDMPLQLAHERAVKLLETVGIPSPEERVRAYPHQLSGGMRQRVMIAIAVACEPSLIIADEPTTALDVTIQAQVLELLRSLKDTMGTAFILVTHDLGIVADFADRIQVMYAGRIVERGTKHEIYKDPKHPYTSALLRSVPRRGIASKERLYSIPGTPPDLMLPLEHCPFAPRCSMGMKICRARLPEEQYITSTHGVACWLYDERNPQRGVRR